MMLLFGRTIMKLLFTGLLILISIFSWSQLDFKGIDYKLPGARTFLITTAIEDINYDGLKDLVIGTGYYLDETYDYNIIIYKQTRDGQLSAPTMFRYPTSYPGLKAMEVADLNNDRLNDIIIVYSDSVGIFYQTNVGTFNKIKSFYSGESVFGLKTGDLNNDGLTDFAVSHSPDAFIKIFTQNTDGSFTTKSVGVQRAFYDELDIADVNGDNLDDIVLINDLAIESSLLILYQKPIIGITNPGFYFIYPGAYYPSFNGIGIGDLNNDGRNDIVGSYVTNSEKIILMYQDSLGEIGNNNIPLPAFTVCDAVEISDLNCDGDNEIIAGNHISVSIYEKSSIKEYNNYIRFDANVNYTPNGIAIGDLNNDNKKDIVTVGDFGNFTILYNTSQPTKFIKFDTYIENLSVTLDTATIRSTFSTPIIDPSPGCKVNRVLQETIITKTKRKISLSDSVSVRYFDFCNNVATDTIRKHYSDTIVYEPTINTLHAIISTDELSVSSSDITIHSENNSSETISIHSNICWNISTDQDWLSPSALTGSGNTSITLTAKENLSIHSRQATLTLTGLDVPDITINVIQKGADPFLSTSTHSIVLNDQINNTIDFNLLSNVNWTISLDEGWLTVDKETGNGNTPITLSAQPNLSGLDKHGIITITGADTMVRTIEIIQYRSVNNQTEIQLEVYPIPAYDHLYIEFSDTSMEGEIAIYTLPGQKLLVEPFTKGKSEINIKHLLAGFYVLTIQTDQGLMVRKFVKQ